MTIELLAPTAFNLFATDAPRLYGMSGERDRESFLLNNGLTLPIKIAAPFPLATSAEPTATKMSELRHTLEAYAQMRHHLPVALRT